jgi:23S rRNA (guanine745-N1)-methyltransferase
MKKQILKFKNAVPILECPLCHKPLCLRESGSLLCPNGHCYDISSKGSVNFIPNQRSISSYDAKFFEHRHRFMQDGFYDPIWEAIAKLVLENRFSCIVDAGCGDGFFASSLAERTCANILAFDISKEAIKQATRNDKDICWLVADLSHIPLQSQSADCVLNIFSPANYSEFQRILSADGILVKVLPGTSHLHELRNAAKSQMRRKEYSNQKVAEHFTQHFSTLDKIHVSKTLPLAERNLEDLLHMTPMLFHVGRNDLDYGKLTHISIEADILVGRARQDGRTEKSN